MDERLVNTASDVEAVAGAIGAGGVFVLLIVIVWQIAATWRARMVAARENQYKELAQKYAKLLEDNVELHRRSIEELTETRRALAALERPGQPDGQSATAQVPARAGE